MKGFVVIGACYGDEGKGLMTDYFSSQFKGPVVRFNGGAQAGHTVRKRKFAEISKNSFKNDDVATETSHHVFKHFGSGTFNRAPTVLTKDFIVNPILFLSEYAELEKWEPEVIIEGKAIVTTPFEMLINQAVERKRSTRHGSCGVGIGETVERSERGPKLEAWMLKNDVLLLKILNQINDVWVDARCKELDVSFPAFDRQKLITKFMEEVAKFNKLCLVVPEVGNVWGKADAIVFEGAQGLRLDQNSADFPHVTRSNTGVKNVVASATDFALKELEVVYVTRSYLTRHGSGPLENETRPDMIYPNIVEKTNVENEFQGHFRFAPLDVDRLCADINRDREHLKGFSGKVTVSLAITCLDQAIYGFYQEDGLYRKVYVRDSTQLRAVIDGEIMLVSKKFLIQKIYEKTKITNFYESYGPYNDCINIERYVDEVKLAEAFQKKMLDHQERINQANADLDARVESAIPAKTWAKAPKYLHKNRMGKR